MDKNRIKANTRQLKIKTEAKIISIQCNTILN